MVAVLFHRQWLASLADQRRIHHMRMEHVKNNDCVGGWNQINDSNCFLFAALVSSRYDDPYPKNTLYFSPPARWGLLDFMSDARLLLLPSFFLLPPPSSSFFRAGPHLPAPDRSGPRRISSASSWSRESERCGPRRTSTGEESSVVGLARPQPSSSVGLAGPQPARCCAPWASPETARNKAI